MSLCDSCPKSLQLSNKHLSSTHWVPGNAGNTGQTPALSWRDSLTSGRDRQGRQGGYDRGNRVLWEHRGRAPHVRELALHDGRVLVNWWGRVSGPGSWVMIWKQMVMIPMWWAVRWPTWLQGEGVWLKSRAREGQRGWVGQTMEKVNPNLLLGVWWREDTKQTLGLQLWWHRGGWGAGEWVAC